MRLIRTNKGQISFKVGRTGILFSGKSKIFLDFHSLGFSSDLIERGRHKKTSDGMITPKTIVDWVESNSQLDEILVPNI